MNNFYRKFSAAIKPATLGLLYGLFATSPAVAEDIEIYTGSISSNSSLQAIANVLFIVDTSGSMTTIVPGAIGTYDPLVTYPAIPGCFNSNTIYVNVDTSSTSKLNNYCTSTSSFDSLKKFNAAPTTFVCQTGQNSIAASGLYTDRVGQFRGNTTRWRGISNNTSNFNKKVECKGDRGIHGDGGSFLYARNNTANSGFGTSSQEINWNKNKFSGKTLYSGNYLNFRIANPPVPKSRLRVMQDALTNVVNTTSGINIGLMRFDKHANGGMVVTPMGQIESTRTTFISDLNYMTASGATPLSETLYEASLYFQGKNVDYGENSEAALSASPWHESMPSHPDSRAPSGGARYKSPIADECQKNYIVLLTDGLPVSDFDIGNDGARRAAIGMTGGCSGNCLDEIATAIGTNDQSSSIDGDQVISTFTIGLVQDFPLLKATAQASKTASGQGDYFVANDAAALNDAFVKIVRNVLDTDASFSSPAVSVNAFNRSISLNDLYFTLFKPAENEHWAGNLKKYKLKNLVDTFDDNNNLDTTEKLPFIVDTGFDRAVDTATGFFATASRSFWSVAVDGSSVAEGGAVQLFTNTRNVYTFPGTYSSSNGVFTPDQVDLTNTANALDKANALVTDALLNTAATSPFAGTTPYRESLLDWAMGLDVRDVDRDGSVTDARLEMGDPLHSQPALIQYGQLGTDSDGDGINDPDLVAYVATNDGYLHAINSITGAEIWSFVPQELLPNLAAVFENDGSSGKNYGLDGDVVAWINDINKDGIINGSDTVYLYVGMRRGGNNIYSFDVTNRNLPKFRWVIKGGTGSFAEMGQTWSTVNVRTMDIGGTEQKVLIFGGGYDENQDDVSVRTPDVVGRAIYIADADTGAYLWSAGPAATGQTTTIPAMQYSIPARVKPLDINGDGFVDRIYVGDMGGQIFRFDFTAGSSLASATGGRIADFAADASINDTRRFYYPPDAALIIEKGQAPYISIVAASGWRAHPLDVDVQDKIYMFRENDVYSAPSSYTTVVEADLFDTTLNDIGVATGASLSTLETSLGSAKGWFIDLDSDGVGFKGEKGLSEPLIIGGTAIVTTFLPENQVVVSGSVCAPQAGTGFAYFLNVTDGTPVFDALSSANNERPARHRNSSLTRSGIPPSPRIIIGDSPTLCIGTECEQSPVNLKMRKMYWYEVEQ